jgi:hypothetical protein
MATTRKRRSRGRYGGTSSRIDLLLEEDVRTHVRRRLMSRAWWLLPLFGARASRVAGVLEERFYPPGTAANGDFELVLCAPYETGPPVLGFAFARKRRCPPAALAALLAELGAPSVEADAGTGAGAGDLAGSLREHDVLLLYDRGTEAEILARAAALGAWLDGRTAVSVGVN